MRHRRILAPVRSCVVACTWAAAAAVEEIRAQRGSHGSLIPSNEEVAAARGEGSVTAPTPPHRRRVSDAYIQVSHLDCSARSPYSWYQYRPCSRRFASSNDRAGSSCMQAQFEAMERDKKERIEREHRAMYDDIKNLRAAHAAQDILHAPEVRPAGTVGRPGSRGQGGMVPATRHMRAATMYEGGEVGLAARQ